MKISVAGRVTIANKDIHFSATKSSSSGTAASGRFRETWPDYDPNVVITGEVRCLQVIGGAFDARGEITDVRNYPDSFPGGFGYKGFTIRGSDGDKSSTGTDTCMRYFVTNPQLDGTCPTEEIVPEPQVDGEVTVRETP